MRNLKTKNHRSEGFAIPIVMLFLLIIGTSAFIFNQRLPMSMRAAAGFQQRADANVIALTVTNNISCSDTWQATISPKDRGLDFKQICTASSQNIGNGRRVHLKRLTKNGPKDLFGPPSSKCQGADYEAAGQCIRASCSGSENTLVIQAIPNSKKNSLTKQDIDWDSNRSVVIGGFASIYVCSQRPPGVFKCSGTSCINYDSDIYDLGKAPSY